MKTVLIFGGSGFVGRHIIRRLAKSGYKIIVPHQNQINEAKLRLLGTTGQIIPISYRSINSKKMIDLINKSEIVINLKTLWDEKNISFQKGIYDFNVDLVRNINSSKKNKQFIFFSGLGVDKSLDSLRNKNIFLSEKFIQNNLEKSVIIRPGIIIGGDDQFLKALLPLFKLSFFIPLFGDGLKKFQPVYIDDVSVAVKKIIDLNVSKNCIFEFVGPNTFTYKGLYKYIAGCMNKVRVLIPIPFSVAKITVSLLEKTPISPLNSEQLKLFNNDNLASDDYKKLEDLGIKPQDIKEIIKNIIKKNM